MLGNRLLRNQQPRSIRASYAQYVVYQQWQFRLAMNGLAILRAGPTATDVSDEILRDAVVGLPMALVWELEIPEQPA